jgi:hypothetical protein
VENKLVGMGLKAVIGSFVPIVGDLVAPLLAPVVTPVVNAIGGAVVDVFSGIGGAIGGLFGGGMTWAEAEHIAETSCSQPGANCVETVEPDVVGVGAGAVHRRRN